MGWKLPHPLRLGLLLLASLPLAADPVERPPGLPEPPPLPDSMRDRGPLQPPPALPDPSELVDQLKQLGELLTLSPEKLKGLRQTIELIERMSETEREAMRIRLSQVTQMTSGLREEIASLAVLLPDDMQSDLSQYWLAATPEERAQARDSLETRSPKEKTQFLTEQVRAFVDHRDQVFRKMRQRLEERKKALDPPANDPAPGNR